MCISTHICTAAVEASAHPPRWACPDEYDGGRWRRFLVSGTSDGVGAVRCPKGLHRQCNPFDCGCGSSGLPAGLWSSGSKVSPCAAPKHQQRAKKNLFWRFIVISSVSSNPAALHPQSSVRRAAIQRLRRPLLRRAGGAAPGTSPSAFRFRVSFQSIQPYFYLLGVLLRVRIG